MLLLSCALAAPALAERQLDDPEAWLSRIIGAGQQVNYHGEVVYRHGEQVQTMEIIRRGGGEDFVERLLMLDGTPAEVVRSGKSIRCILPDGRASLAGQRVPRNPFPVRQWRAIEAAGAQYEFLDLGRGRVAGRDCQVIGIKPRDGYRYGYRLWIDTETGLPLKSNLVDEHDNVIEEAAFTRVRFPNEIEDARLQPTLAGETLNWRVATGDDGDLDRAWTVAALPEGFVEYGLRRREHGAVQQIFSDGFATVSVFVTPVAPDRAGLDGTSRMGAVNAFGTVIDGRQVTVVGEVPVATVRMIGESITFK